jgi:hypothetical protein
MRSGTDHAALRGELVAQRGSEFCVAPMLGLDHRSDNRLDEEISGGCEARSLISIQRNSSRRWSADVSLILPSIFEILNSTFWIRGLGAVLIAAVPRQAKDSGEYLGVAPIVAIQHIEVAVERARYHVDAHRQESLNVF